MTDLFVIRKNGKNGYIDRSGSVVIQPQYKIAFPFSEGLAVACPEESKCGYIDKTGNMAVGPQFATAYRFSEGLAAVEVDGKVGFIDPAGKFIIAPQFDSFSMGDGAIAFSDGLVPMKFGETFGYVDATGKTVIAPQFKSASPFFDGLAAVSVRERFGFIDKVGKFLIEPQFESAQPFSRGLAAIKIGEKFGYVDKTGRIVIEPRFDTALPFGDEDLAQVVLEQKVGFINKSGSYSIAPQFQATGLPDWKFAFMFTSEIGRISFSDGVAAVKDANGKAGFIDKGGNFINGLRVNEALPFVNGLALVFVSDSDMAWINKDGAVIWQGPWFEETSSPNTNTNAAANKSSSTPTPANTSANTISNTGTGTGYLIKDTNLRKEPSPEAMSVGIHFANAKVQILEQRRFERNGEMSTWYRIKILETGCSTVDSTKCGKNAPGDADDGWVNAKLVK